ncbi:hypothetical protein Bbelb_306400 [Branchiostoma belcheri]|nr:hypothetical protein Bbelb_306400 [Branchiostoma belcheri]
MPGSPTAQGSSGQQKTGSKTEHRAANGKCAVLPMDLSTTLAEGHANELLRRVETEKDTSGPGSGIEHTNPGTSSVNPDALTIRLKGLDPSEGSVAFFAGCVLVMVMGDDLCYWDGNYKTCYGDFAYCCGPHEFDCCDDGYYVYSAWWFWFIWVFLIIFIAACSYVVRRRCLATQTGTTVVIQRTIVPPPEACRTTVGQAASLGVD